MKAYHIYLLRHGMTAGNLQGQYIGKTDLPLCDDGIKKLNELTESHDYPYAELFFSSPLKRCVESVEILYPDAKPQIVPGLSECDFGEFEGKTFDELKDNENYRNWIACAGSTAPGGGESGVDFQTRSCAAFADIVDSVLKSGTQTACIMAHGGTIMSVLSTFGFPRKQFYDWMTANGTGFEVVITPQLWVNNKIIEVTQAIPYEKT